MTRIVGGAARGRRISAPPGRGTRPTSDRAREGLFSTVEALLGSLAGRRVLDLYAGSGAVGLEALSRGAHHVRLVESDDRAVRVIRGNVAALGLAGADVTQAAVERVVGVAPSGPAYDLVFADPPYATTDDAVGGVLAALVEHDWLGPGALVVVERPTRGAELEWPAGIEADRSRRYGEGTLWYGRAAR
jgi:16S rRNA (guanine966-N2)-methyltransferase